MLSGDQIRILELLPSGDEGPAAPLRGHVYIVSLSSNPDYEAVSYVWGKPDGRTNIEVSGRSFGISSNLDALLRRLRYTNRKRQIWADQICIDQSNLSEKTTQVKMMGDIYSKCRQCLIWMGEIPESIPQSGVEDAIHLLEFMATPDDVNVPEFLSTRDKFLKVFEVLYLIHPHGNTWWSRIWTDDVATEGISRWAMDLKGFPKRDADNFYRDWAHDHYNACNGRALDRSFLRSTVEDHAGSTRVLGVSGVMVDTVQIISPQRSTAPESDARISENLRAWYKLAASRQPGGVSAGTRPEFDEQFCRLVVADILELRDEDDPESQSRMPNAEDLGNAWKFIKEGIQSPGEVWIKESHMPSQLCNQVFFVTASGMMGMGPWDTLPRDEVWIFDGGNYPFTIRPRHERGSKAEFDFVGCCYIQGIMFGERFQKQEELSSRRIYIY
ncbi:Heterokaryon incompatibility protein 6, OR allele [Colletotrichum shisoi]|uniref:Heterokaryon incompatibility protein 6, OR allele n=1 Tax=Colletotrichum shisoi TaxID=2078593 RepID=A0A5Q4C239_9PEZI|nr:Heterokaryon incompatibility protein 6, OR allele [Colletotrichum shisoi]